MATYLLKRLFLIVPTLFGIMLINFVIVQFAPGGPVEQAIAQATGFGSFSSTASVSSAGSMGPSVESGYNGASGLDPEIIADLERQFGFDKPPYERFVTMMGNYITLDQLRAELAERAHDKIARRPR